MVIALSVTTLFTFFNLKGKVCQICKITQYIFWYLFQ